MCMKWKDGKKLDVILVTNMDAWRQRLDVSTANRSFDLRVERDQGSHQRNHKED